MITVEPGNMEQALHDISADECRYPCGAWMSHRTRARIGLGRADLMKCSGHEKQGVDCVPGAQQDYDF